MESVISTTNIYIYFRNTVIGLIALLNSIRQNTKNHVKYHILVEKEILKDVQ